MNKILLVCLVALLTVSCISKKERSQDMNASSTEASTSADRIVPQYAKGFEITYTNGYVLVDIQDPQYEERTSFHYALVQRGTDPKGIPADYTVIETPIRSAICMTSLQLSNFIKGIAN